MSEMEDVVGRKGIAIALLAVAAFMLLGFSRSSSSIAAPSTIVALLITVVAPAAGGVFLLRGGDLARGRRLETRLPCPVCLVMMDKAQVKGRSGFLTLDHCQRCGGVWFERGEVQALASREPAALWAEVAPRADIPNPPCHSCRSPLDRDAETC